jgi:hypothetical protein
MLVRPIEAPGEKLSDVRMRGNLDLRRESFVLGFGRSQVGERWQAALADRGEGDTVRAELAATHKAKAAATKTAELAAENDRRRLLALEIMNRKGSCSQRELADAIGLKSERSVEPVFANLVATNVARRDGNRGYVFVDAEASS